MTERKVQSPTKTGTRTKKEIAKAVEKVKVLKLADHPFHNGRVWTPIQMLEKVVKDLNEVDENGDPLFDYNKVVVILLHDKDNQYHTGMAHAGMDTIEIVTLLDVIKTKLNLKLLGYGEE
jgi:hypothetical protein